VDRIVALFSRFAILRFAVIGTLGVPVDAGGLWLMLNVVHSPYYLGRPASWVVAASFTWIGNRYFTFGARRARGLAATGREWLRFLAANLVGGLVNVGLSITLERSAPPPIDNPYLALAIGILAGLVFNFTLSKRLVFKGPI
jgi:putative flippase GtrA